MHLSSRDVNRYAPPELNLLMLLNSLTYILDAVPMGRCYGISSDKRVNCSIFNLPCTDFHISSGASCHVTVISLYYMGQIGVSNPFPSFIYGLAGHTSR